MRREPADPALLRVSDAEREDVAAMLARAMVAGQLTPGEYSDRVAAAQSARLRGELTGLLTDLPGTDLHASLAVDALDLVAGLGGSLRRTGYWRVPPTVRVASWVGGVHLDLSEAECVTPVVALELSTGMCSPVIVLPEGGTVDVDGLVVAAGAVRDATVHRRERGVPHLVVRGRHSFGDVVLRHPTRRRWERWRAAGRLPRPPRRVLPRRPRPDGTPPDPSRGS